MLDILLDASIDTLKVLPILYLVYLLVSYLGHNSNNKYTKLMRTTKKYGPLIGGVTGCIPQCGFSVVMADLYSKKAITIGTLVAVMIATSDEAIPLMISKPDFIVPMLVMIAVKLVVAILFGYIFDLLFKLFKKPQSVDVSVFEKTHNHDCDLTACSNVHVVHCHGEKCQHKNHHHSHDHGHHDCVDNIFLDALMHTLKIFIFLFVATVIVNILVHYIGLDNLAKVFTSNKYVQPFLAALIGLIPSCASSVFLVSFYIEGVLSFGAMLAGLCAGSGIGIVVLFAKNKKHLIANMLIVLSLYLIGCLVGLIANIIIIA